MSFNKSLSTNLVAALVAAVGLFVPGCPASIRSLGLFAFSGAVTNWLAIHMLFERVPGLYGSGVVPSRFEEFKEGIRRLVLEQFFTPGNLASFFAGREGGRALDPARAARAVDLDALFDALEEGVAASPFGAMLGTLGGKQALEPLREPFRDRARSRLEKFFAGDRFQELVREILADPGEGEGLRAAAEELIDRRLAELTPRMVKEIVQEMIRRHLGWLVVWGGVFGGLMGLAASLVA